MNNEETLLMNEQSAIGGQPKAVGTPGQIHTGWKRVTIGGVSGILIGAAAAYGVDKWQELRVDENSTEDTDSPANDEHPMAHNTTDDMSFAEAFAAARDEVGPGGVFTWHGNVYGTFTADEWNAISAEEQKAYFDSINANAIEPQHEAPHEAYHPAAEQQEVPPTAHPDDNPSPQQDRYIPSGSQVSTDDPEVRVVGSGQIPNPDGTVTNVVEIEIDGHGGIILGGNEPEVAIIDVDDSGTLTEPDIIIDLVGGQVATVGDIVEMENPQGYYASEDTSNDPYNEPIQDCVMDDPAMNSDMDSGVDMATDVDLISI